MDTISDKQRVANRANAKKSAGPRTPEGKAKSSANARKHCFSGVDFSIVKIEEREAINHLRDDLLADFQPVTSQETFALERIALAQHNLLRIARLEAGLGSAALNQALSSLGDETPFIPLHDELHVDPIQAREQNRAYCLAQGFDMMNRKNSATWALFLRYQAQAERHYVRATQEFERLKSLRPPSPKAISPNEPILQPRPQGRG
jgi:hypothetical protein